MSNTNSKSSKRITNGVLAATFLSLSALTATASSATSGSVYNALGSGSEVRSELLNSTNSPINNFEAKCGEETTESKAKEAKCGEGKCGESKKDDKKAEKKSSKKKSSKKADAKTTKKAESKSTEAKCGEGKCGSK